MLSLSSGHRICVAQVRCPGCGSLVHVITENEITSDMAMVKMHDPRCHGCREISHGDTGTTETE